MRTPIALVPSRLFAAVSLCFAAITCTASAGPGSLSIEFGVAGGAPQVFSPAPTAIGACGPIYIDEILTPEVRFAWNMVVVGDDYGQFLGTLKFVNTSTTPQVIDTVMEVTIDPATSCLIGGSLVGTLNTPANGGSISTVPAQPMLSTLLDGTLIETLIQDPYSLSSPVADCLTIGPDAYGQPIPSGLGPSVVGGTTGIRLIFELSAGTEVEFTICTLVVLPSSPPTACPCALPPCTVSCPAGATIESEPCGATLNDGCAMIAPAFATIACGETICGTAWADGCDHDEDWYEITVTVPTIITLTGTAEFPLRLGVADTSGVAGCVPVPPLNPFAIAAPCATAELVACLLPGTWWLVVSVDSLAGHACAANGNNYVITLDCCTFTDQRVSYYAMKGVSATQPWLWQIETSEFVTQGVTPAVPLGAPALTMATAFANSVPGASGNLSCGNISRINVSTFGICPAGSPSTALMLIRACGDAGTGTPSFPRLSVWDNTTQSWCQPNATTPAAACAAVFGCQINPSFIRVEPSGADCNRNGIDDGIEILIGASADLDGNGIPDECEGCAADLDRDGLVDGADLGLLLGNWGQPGVGDLDGSGAVDGADIGILLNSWGRCR